MKLVLLVFVNTLFGYAMAEGGPQIRTLNETGLPDYRKLFNINTATKVFKDKKRYAFEINQNDVQRCINFNIKLSLNKSQFNHLKNGSLNYKLSDSINIQKNILNINIGLNRNYQFDLTFTDDSTNLKFSNNSIGKNNLGYIILQNRFARYATFQSHDSTKSFNLAIIDKNLNGLIDSNDVISASYDKYFLVKPTSFGCFLLDSILLDFEDELFLINWHGGYNISIKPFNEKASEEIRKIQLNKQLYNFTISDDGTTLKSIIRSDKTLITFWASYCSPCIQSIPKLNAHNNNVIGFQADYTDKSVDDIGFRNFPISSEMLGFLGINGFPNYMVLDKELNILYYGRFIDEALEYIQ